MLERENKNCAYALNVVANITKLSTGSLSKEIIHSKRRYRKTKASSICNYPKNLGTYGISTEHHLVQSKVQNTGR
jgi:hypothetical protein